MAAFSLGHFRLLPELARVVVLEPTVNSAVVLESTQPMPTSKASRRLVAQTPDRESHGTPGTHAAQAAAPLAVHHRTQDRFVFRQRRGLAPKCRMTRSPPDAPAAPAERRDLRRSACHSGAQGKRALR